MAKKKNDKKKFVLDEKSSSLEDFTEMVRSKCVLTERWMVLDPQYDPSKKKKGSLVMENDVTVEGELRVKRCVKIYDDRTYQVLIDSVDMTRQFDHINNSKKLETTYDADKLFHALMTKKVCQGLRTYDPANPILIQGNLPVIQRGKLWYASDCTIVVQKVFMGNSCNSCMKVRNQVRRVLQNDTRKKSRRPAMKQVKSTFGKALYSLLNDFSGRGPIPPSQYARENMVFDDKLGIHINFELHQRLFIAATMPPPPMPLSKSRNRKNRRGSTRSRYSQPSSTMTSQDAYPIQQFITEDGQVCYVANVIDSSGGSGDLQYGMPMMVEKFENPDMNEYVAINEHGNIIIQNVQGQEFTLAEGQEYELIGEAPSVPHIDPIEIMPADNQNIQIFEVDDATMQQIEVHGGMDDMRIASVDPNDPNLSQLFRAFQSQVQGLAL